MIYVIVRYLDPKMTAQLKDNLVHEDAQDNKYNITANLATSQSKTDPHSVN
jgi:hypothetical protein